MRWRSSLTSARDGGHDPPPARSARVAPRSSPTSALPCATTCSTVNAKGSSRCCGTSAIVARNLAQREPLHGFSIRQHSACAAVQPPPQFVTAWFCPRHWGQSVRWRCRGAAQTGMQQRARAMRRSALHRSEAKGLTSSYRVAPCRVAQQLEEERGSEECHQEAHGNLRGRDHAACERPSASIRKMAPPSAVTGSGRTWSGPGQPRRVWNHQAGEADEAAERDRDGGQQ